MATYQYECLADGEMILVTRPMTEPEGEYFCETCEKKMHRVYNVPGVKFNAGGFYSTGG